jgi:hypothetical protein
MKTSVTIAFVIAAASGSSGAAAQYLWQARDAAQAPPPGAAAAAAPSVQGSGSGLQIFIDPVTGQIRPPEQEDLRALARQPAIPQFTPVPQLFFGVGGIPSVLLDSSFDSYMVAIKRADGALDMDCLPSKAQAVDAVAGRLAPTGSVQKKPTLDEK